MRSARALAALVLAVALPACSLAPAYQRPEPPVPAAFPGAAAAKDGTTAASDLGWRDVLGDPRLQALVALSLERNRDLKVAVLNVEAVRAQYGITRSAQLPHLAAAGAVTRSHTPADLSVTTRQLTSSAWSVGLGLAAFEIDYLGKLRNLSEAALEQWLASEEAARSARLSLAAQVAAEYLSGRALEEQVALARSTLETVEASLALTRRSAEAGRVSELDLRTAESQVETARANLAAAELARVRSDNALVLLAGGPIPADLPPPRPLDAAQVAEVPAGLPSEVLVRRPDVLAAEHALRSANAVIGAARAAFFPSISLTAFGGTASGQLERLFRSDQTSWSFTPSIVAPIFQGGALKSSLDLAHVRKSTEVARYERAVQGAFREVADALAGGTWLEAQLQAQAARVAAEERRFALSEHRYRAGVDSYLTLLVAQRDLYAARQQLIQTRLARLTGLLDLYKALGGGWRERTETAGG